MSTNRVEPTGHGDPRSRAEYLPWVQILRFAAAAAVLVGHVEYEALAGKAGAAPSFGAFSPFDLGVGVDIFFIVSGFIMVHLTRRSFGRPGVFGDFLTRRIARVVPLYWLFTLLTIGAALIVPERMASGRVDPAHVAASLAFLPWPGASGLFPVLGLGWTLNYEMLFYAVFAVGLLFSRRTGMTVIVGILAAIWLAGRLAPDSVWLLKFWGDPIIFEFVLGMALAEIYGRGMRISPATALMFVVLGLAFLWSLSAFREFRPTHRILSAAPGAALIAAAAILVRERSYGAIVAAFAFLGDASYALYLSHPFAIKALSLVWSRAGLPVGWEFVIIACGCAILLSIVTHLWLERPLIVVARHILRRVRPAPVRAPPKMAS